METVRASFMWPGPDVDVFTLFREPTPDLWEADPIDDDWEFAVLLTLDEDERETGEVTGIEIVGFLTFDRWGDLPVFPILWQLPEQEPGPLVEVLKRQQELLRQKAPLIAQRR
jgi:hypothetical protein